MPKSCYKLPKKRKRACLAAYYARKALAKKGKRKKRKK